MVPTPAPPSGAARLASRTLQLLAATVVMLGAGPSGPVSTPLFGVAILAVPPLVGRCCGRRFRPLQRTWVSLGLAVHPVGVLYGFYAAFPWYDHLTHLASASLVAGGLYLLAAVVASPGTGRDLPGRVHLLVLAGLLAAGLGWEVLELHVGFLSVHGPEDTLADVAYDVIGWLVVAPRWRSALGALPTRLATRLERAGTPT